MCVAALLAIAAPALADDAAWSSARDAVRTLDWPAAATRYEKLVATVEPGSTPWSEATFGRAVALQHTQPASKETTDAAAALFRQVIDGARDEPYIARSLMNLGRIAELRDYPADVADLDGARAFYEKVMRRWPDEPIGSEAALRAAATRVMTYDAPDFANVRAGLKQLEDWLATRPTNPYAGVMWQYAGDGYFRPLADYRASLRCYDMAESVGWADPGNQGATYWRCARMADALNDRDAAVRYYTRIVTRTPISGKAYAAIEALKRLNAPLPDSPLLHPPAERKERP